MTVSAEEFLRRFLLHTLPRGLDRIRFFGFMGGPRRAKMPQQAGQLRQAKAELSVGAADSPRASFPCPVCATPTIFGERLSAAQIRRAGVQRGALRRFGEQHEYGVRLAARSRVKAPDGVAGSPRRPALSTDVPRRAGRVLSDSS